MVSQQAAASEEQGKASVQTQQYIAKLAVFKGYTTWNPRQDEHMHRLKPLLQLLHFLVIILLGNAVAQERLKEVSNHAVIKTELEGSALCVQLSAYGRSRSSAHPGSQQQLQQCADESSTAAADAV